MRERSDHEVVAFDGLHRGPCEQRKLRRRGGARWRSTPAGRPVGQLQRLEQPEQPQGRQHTLNLRGELLLRPFEEQFRCHIRIDAPSQALDVGRGHHWIGDEGAGHQRRQREQVLDIVTVIGRQHRHLFA